MTALTEEELNVVFEHFTQKNQVESFDTYFASGKKEEVDEKEQPKEEKNPVSAEKQEPVSAPPQQNKKPEGQKAGQQNVRHPQSGRPAGQQNRPHPQTGNTPAATVSESGSTGTRAVSYTHLLVLLYGRICQGKKLYRQKNGLTK